MQDSAVCPYFDQDEDVCDVGCGYISSHDASMIIKFCSCQYHNCQKYRELSDRIDPSETEHKQDKPVTKPVINEPQLPILGLASCGITAACYSIDKLPFSNINLHLMAMILLLGSTGLISAGLSALKKSPLRAIAFTGFGLFWLSILALDTLPRAGYGTLPGSIPMMGYFGMWGIFSLIICQGLDQMTRSCRLVFAMMTAFLILLSMANAINSTALFHSAALIGLLSSLPGMYHAFRYLSIEALGLIQTEVPESGKIRS